MMPHRWHFSLFYLVAGVLFALALVARVVCGFQVSVTIVAVSVLIFGGIGIALEVVSYKGDQ